MKLCPILISLDELPNMYHWFISMLCFVKQISLLCLDSRLDRNSLSGSAPANLNNLTKVNEL